MKQKTTFSLWKRLLLLLVLFVPLVQSLGQTKIYATDLISDKNVDNPRYATDGNLASKGTLHAHPGALMLGKKSGFLEYKFPNAVPKGKQTYIKIGMENNELLNGLLGGSVGKLLSGLLNELLLGSHRFDVSAYNGNNKVLEVKSVDGFGTKQAKLIQDKDGEYMIAFQLDQSFDRMTVGNSSTALLGLTGDKLLDVYDTYYVKEDGGSCSRPIGTSFDSAGIEIDLLGGLLQNKFYEAIDGKENTYSLLKRDGAVNVGVGGYISQFFYFPTSSNEATTVNLTIESPKGLLSLDLLSAIELRAYNGDKEVYTKSLEGGLLNGVNLLGLLKTPGKKTLTFAPGKAFDRIELRANNTLNVGLLSDGLRIYDIERFDTAKCPNPNIIVPAPTESPFDIAACATVLKDFKNVDFVTNAIDGNNETFATLYANNGSLLSALPSSGMIELAYNQKVAAHTTSYIRIDSDKDVLEALLGGTLGKLVDGVAGLLLGDHYFEVEAFSNGVSVSKSSSISGFEGTTNGVVSLVQDKIGRYYLAVTPTTEYNSIRITNKVTGLPTGEQRMLKVYNMCREIGSDPCYPAQFTSYNQVGLNLSIASLNEAGVKNPYHAISGNSSNYSEISSGTLAVGTGVKQVIYFPKPSSNGDKLEVRVQFNPNSVLSLDLLGSYKVTTYLGSTKKQEFTLKQGLLNNLDLLGLLQSGGVQSLVFDTSVEAFDRVEISTVTLLNLGVTPAIRLYNVKRINDVCIDPMTESPFVSSICATELLGSKYVDDISNIFNGNFDSFATINSDAGILLGGNKRAGFVEVGYDHIVKAGTTSYIRFDYDKGILKGLLGGSLGNIVSGLLNNIVLGDHFFEIEVKDENGVVLEGNSRGIATTFKNGEIRVVSDKLGRTYLAITPTKDYKSVKITDRNESLLGILAPATSMNVYNMCYEGNADSCVDAFATSFDFTGLALTVNDLSGAGVEYPERAIDSNTTNYSRISLGTLNVAGSVKQWVFFNSVSDKDDVTNIKFRTESGGVDLNVLGRLEIKAYLGDKVVNTLDLSSGLINGINVLDLINKGDIVNLPYTPGVEYDRISIGLKSVLNVSVFPPINLYSVERSCQSLNQDLVSWKSYKVNGDSTVQKVTGGEEVEYIIHVKNVGAADVPTLLIEDRLPAGLTWTSGGTHSNGVVTFKKEDVLVVDGVVTFSFKARVNTDLEGISQIRNIAVVKVDETDKGVNTYPAIDNKDPKAPNTSEKPGTVLVVDPLYDIELSKVGSSNGKISNQAQLGDEITYTISVENKGNKALRNVLLNDVLGNVLGSEIEIVEVGSGVIQNSTISYVIAQLNVGQKETYVVRTKVIGLPTTNKISNKVISIYTLPDNTIKTKEVVFELASNCNDIFENSIVVEQVADVCAYTEFVLKAALTNLAPKDLKNPIFKWYKNADLSDMPLVGQEVKTTIASTTKFYVTVEGLGYCFNGTPAEVEVKTLVSPAKPVVSSTQADICEGTLTTLSTIEGATEYQWFLNGVLIEAEDEKGQPVRFGHSIEVNTGGDYSVIVSNGICYSQESDAFTVKVKEAAELSIEGDQRIITKVNVAIKLPKVTSKNGTVTWYNEKGELFNETEITFAVPGIYTYTVVADLNGCSTAENIIITVLDSNNCPPQIERVYAKDKTTWGSIITGGIANKTNAIDGNPTTYSEIVTGLGLLGIGTTWQNIYFDEVVPAGTPVTIKLGKQYSGLMLAGGLSVQGLDENDKPIGTLKSVQGGLLDLLAADNVIEYTFVPTSSGKPKAFKGVRVSQGSLLGLAQISKVYGVYYSKSGNISCAPVATNINSGVLDVLHGVQDLGLGVASATASVTNPWNAVDNKPDTYALISRGVAVLNEASLTVVFKQQAMPGDELHIITEIPGNPILSLELIKGYSIQRYLGDKKVGPKLEGGLDVLGLKLLGLGYGNKHKVIVAPYDEQPYDRVKISYGSVVGVLGDFTRIYDVNIVPTIGTGVKEDEVIDVCNYGMLKLSMIDACTTYEIYTSETGSDQLTEVTPFEFYLKGLSQGEQTIWIQNVRSGCPLGPRIPVKVNVKNCSVKTNLNITHKIK
ncbi:DUF11 domain-containing protein [Myroides odoratimimus]|uniref:DUF11 domain-containing protein n=1 Tax=Myroides odoratimimus TaxID=76832 RepID=UPI0025780AA2|nr:DUF11 domain-containing protein [Myroides odoratimimus]MDM1396903.1 DUF11 domain-containing protein [Myroides odoratimimus]